LPAKDGHALQPDGLEDAWHRLRRHVAWSDAGAVGFVLTGSGQTAELLRQRAEWQLQSRGRRLETIVPDTSERLSTLRPAIEAAASRSHSVWVQQIAADAPGARQTPWGDAWRELLRSLNHRRDSLRSALGTGTLYLVGSRELKAAAQEYAPDVWSIRAFVIDAEAAPVPVPAPPPAQLDDLGSERDPSGLLAGVSVGEEDELGRELAAMLRRTEAAIAQGRSAEAIELANGILRKARRRETEGLALLLRGSARRESGDIGGGLSDGLEALERLPRSGRQRLRWLEYVADGAASLGDLSTARRLWTESLTIARELERALGTLQSRRDLSVSLERVGDVLRAQGDAAAALSAYQEALTIARELDQALGTPESRRDLSISEARLANLRRGQAGGSATGST